MKEHDETVAVAVLLALAAFAVLGVSALNLWSWVSSGLLGAAVFMFVRALFVDSRQSDNSAPINFDLGQVSKPARKEGLH